MNIKLIKKLRTENDYSQEFVAKEIGMSRASYILVEQGKKDLCLGDLKKLGELYRISIGDLIADNKKKQQKNTSRYWLLR